MVVTLKHKHLALTCTQLFKSRKKKAKETSRLPQSIIQVLEYIYFIKTLDSIIYWYILLNGSGIYIWIYIFS